MKNKILYMFILTLLAVSCTKDLEVENNTDPSIENIYGDPEAVYGVTSSMFFNWYMRAQTHSWSPAMAMMTMADQGTSSWMNSGMFDLSSEPRAELDNSQSYQYQYIFEHYYKELYNVLNTSNDVLTVIEGGMEIGDLDANGIGEDTKMVEAMSYFAQGVSLGYLGLNYDQAYIITNTTADPASETPKNYSEVIDAAIVSLQKAADIATANNFIIPDDWINGKDYSNNEFAQIAYSYMARLLAYSPRNASQNNSTNWSQVIQYVDKGISSDLEIYLDNVNWKNWVYHYTYERKNWVMVDARIINLLDNNYPERITNSTDPGVATSADARLASDFTKESVCNFKPERGYYHFSYYLYTRLDYTFSNPADFPEIYVNELELLKAEAYVHLGQLSQAITILNNSSRSSRGGLPALSSSATQEEVLDAIFYERDLEFFVAGFGIGFYDMRRRDMLQKGSLLHFPIPSKELNVVGIPIYTFGGEANADGIGTSNGGWF
ncbi:MAG: hypothetical protein DRI86_01565 [Bacteroidetes bacterium]|nr:MAG: hypothetical protein DRI86_01565 [Bacteroidota bacterium]